MLSAKEAAAAVGMTKAGVIRSIHTGKLSATRTDNGQFVIDPVELYRVYDPLPSIDGEVSMTGNSALKIDGNGNGSHEETWHAQLTLLERIIRDKDEVIADLRQRLDQNQAQVSQLTAMLAQLTPPPAARKGWWSRLLGGQ